MKANNGDKTFQLFTTICLICSTMVGFTLFGVSIAKVSLIPLVIYLVLKYGKNSLSSSLKLTGTRKIVLMWFLAIVFSSISGIARDTSVKGYYSTLFFNILQVLFIYLPIFVLVINEPNKKKVFEKAAITAAGVNAIWAIIQYSFWIIAKFDFNNFIFNEFLHGILGQSKTLYNFETGHLTLRATGLTSDAALMTVCLIIGYCLTEKVYWKAIFLTAAFFSQARSGIICILFITIISILKRIKHIKFSDKTIKRLIISAIGISVIVLVIIPISGIKNVLIDSIQMAMYRIGTIFDSDKSAKSGTDRHMMYLPVSILVFIFEQPILWKIFGSGIRTSGVALVNSQNYSNMLSFYSIMKNESWAIECDYAEVLLGAGFVGIFSMLFLYILSLMYCSDQKIKNTVICLMVFGFFYGYSCLTMTSLFYIYMLDFKALNHCKNNPIK